MSKAKGKSGGGKSAATTSTSKPVRAALRRLGPERQALPADIKARVRLDPQGAQVVRARLRDLDEARNAADLATILSHTPSMNLNAWSGDGPGAVVDLLADQADEALVEEYAQQESYDSAGTQTLLRVLAHARELGAVTGIIEYRYIDLDWRSEHTRFYSTTYRRYPSVAHRLHFFSKDLNPRLLDSESQDIDFGALGYLGYTVLRPVMGSPVGRTTLPPLAGDEQFVSCLTSEHVNLFGHRMRVTGLPFMAQDGQVCICAHTSVWVTAYYHHLAAGQKRWLSGQIAGLTSAGLGLARSEPMGGGLSIYQMKELFSSVGLSPIVYAMKNLPKSEDVDALICRYLNSGIPVTYRRLETETEQEVHIDYLAHDDLVGPYIRLTADQLRFGVEDAFLLVPLPPKIYLAAEDAEALGAQQISQTLRTSSNAVGRDLYKAQTNDADLTFRTTAIASNALKLQAAERWPAPVALAYRRHPMSRYVYVVEAQRRSLRRAGKPSVVAEAIIDATDSLQDLRVLAWRTPGELFRWWPDDDEYSYDTYDENSPALRPLRPTLSSY